MMVEGCQGVELWRGEKLWSPEFFVAMMVGECQGVEPGHVVTAIEEDIRCNDGSASQGVEGNRL